MFLKVGLWSRIIYKDISEFYSKIERHLFFIFSHNGFQVSGPHTCPLLVFTSSLGVWACHQKEQNREIYMKEGREIITWTVVHFLCFVTYVDYSCVTFIVTRLTRCSAPLLLQNGSTSTLLLWTCKFAVSCCLYISYNHCIPVGCERAKYTAWTFKDRKKFTKILITHPPHSAYCQLYKRCINYFRI